MHRRRIARQVAALWALACGTCLASVTVLTMACGDDAAGDGVALAVTPQLVIVAHPDDDLIFSAPEVVNAVHHGGLTTVYVTAGNGKRGLEAAWPRARAVRMAYGVLAGTHAWQCGELFIGELLSEHCRLATANVSLVFLNLPDGGKHGEHDGLGQLLAGQAREVRTVARRPMRVNRDALLAALAEIVASTAPSRIDTLDLTSAYGRDHRDHLAVGALALWAAAAARYTGEFSAHRGYNVETEAPNLDEATLIAGARGIRHYAACTDGCAPCGHACMRAADAHETWLARHYLAATRRRAWASAALQLVPRSPQQKRVVAQLAQQFGVAPEALCLSWPSVVPCTQAPHWAYSSDGALQALGEAQAAPLAGAARSLPAVPISSASAALACLQVETPVDALTVAPALGSCAPNAASYWLHDTHGRIWFGAPPTVVPAPGPRDRDADADHPRDSRCLTIADDGRVLVAPCNGSALVAWEPLLKTVTLRAVR